jgi:hypothetical protein
MADQRKKASTKLRQLEFAPPNTCIKKQHNNMHPPLATKVGQGLPVSAAARLQMKAPESDLI